MKYHLYLSLIPEALVVSMLPPVEFGRYLAVGTKKRAKEQAMYFELKTDFKSEYFDLSKAIRHCKPHEDGQPKHSVYVSTYRVLEHVPLDALGNLCLTTPNGMTLELEQADLLAEDKDNPHLYQELCPVHPLIASLLSPTDFCKFITDPSVNISMPKICFLELQLGKMESKSWKKVSSNLPYKNISHLRDCLLELGDRGKNTKTVDRVHSPHVPYRCIKSGFFIGDQNTVLYYPFPSAAEMEKKHHRWWRWA